MPGSINPVVMDEATDWSGQILPRQMAHYLFPSCIVRVVIHNSTSDCGEAIYFRITKIKDGTFWSIAQDTYRLEDWVGFSSGEQMTFRKEHINEIPLSWQPKRYQKEVAHLKVHLKDVGYFPTGMRGQ